MSDVTPRNPVPEHLRVEVAEMLRSNWRVKALLATEDGRLGVILRAVLACPTNDPPWLGPSAIVDRAGIVLSNWVDEHNHRHFAAAVCTLEDLVNNCRSLCEALSFTDAEANALFFALRAWIKVDARPATEQPEDRIPLEYRPNAK
jgi:hypothetical protein